VKRGNFLAVLASAAAAAVPLHAFADSLVGARLTQYDLFAALPVPGNGDWLRVVMGSGVQYQKQIGLGIERGLTGDRRLFVETQIGEAGGIACNPNTLKKTYLREPHFHALISPYPVLAMIARSGNTITRWADVEDGQTQNPADARLRLLDAAYLYGNEPLTIRSLEPATLHITGVAHATTHVVADVAPGSRLRRVELWHTPRVPFGVARYRATVSDFDPFELALGSYGAAFRTDLPQSLETLRAMTPDGMNVST
jgi:hypothetical protein